MLISFSLSLSLSLSKTAMMILFQKRSLKRDEQISLKHEHRFNFYFKGSFYSKTVTER